MSSASTSSQLGSTFILASDPPRTTIKLRSPSSQSSTSIEQAMRNTTIHTSPATSPPSSIVSHASAMPLYVPGSSVSQDLPTSSQPPMSSQKRKRTAPLKDPKCTTTAIKHWHTDRGKDGRSALDILYEWMTTESFDKDWNGANGKRRSTSVAAFNSMLKDNEILTPRTWDSLEGKVSSSCRR